MDLHEGAHSPTYLGFGAGYWHSQNYGRIHTVHVSGDINAFQLQLWCYNSWISMYFGGTLACNTGW